MFLKNQVHGAAKLQTRARSGHRNSNSGLLVSAPSHKAIYLEGSLVFSRKTKHPRNGVDWYALPQVL